MKKEGGKKKRRWITALAIILAILLLLFGAAFFTVNHYLNKIQRVDNDNIDIIEPSNEDFDTDEAPEGLEEIDSDSIEWDEAFDLGDDNLINILLVGQDRREGQGRQRSDTMIVCSINPETYEMSMVSFLRDLYVQFPGDYSDNRLNAAYAFGGFPLLCETLTLNFGIHIDGCIEVDFYSFKDIVDAVGGVDINLTAAEANYLGSGVKEGMNHLDGATALDYSRIRMIDSDFYRTGRQRNVLNAIINNVRTYSVSQIVDLVNALLPYVTTDMSNTQILSLAAKLAPHVSSLQPESYFVPPLDAYKSAMIRGMAVLVPDRTLIKEYLRNEYLPLGEQ